MMRPTHSGGDRRRQQQQQHQRSRSPPKPPPQSSRSQSPLSLSSSSSSSSSLSSSAAASSSSSSSSVGGGAGGRTSGGGGSRRERREEDPEVVYMRLARQYRQLERDHKTYTEETHAVLRRQRAALEQLGAENARLKGEVALEAKAFALQEQRRRRGGFGLGPVMPVSSVWAGGGGGKNPGSVAWLQEQLQRFLRGNARERRRQAKARAEIRVLRAKVDQQRRALGGVSAARNGALRRERRVGVLEGRLATALARRDAAVAANRALRGEIEELRRERVRFGEGYRRLEEGVVECDRAMAAAIEACNLAYEQQDAAQSELAALKAGERTARESFRRQLAELEDALEAETRRGAMRRALVVVGVDEEAEEAKRRRKERARLRAQRQAEMKQVEEETAALEARLAGIVAATGAADIEELLRAYAAQEERGFSLYTFVNEAQWRERKALEAEIAALRAEWASLSRAGGEGGGAGVQQQQEQHERSHEPGGTEAQEQQQEGGGEELAALEARAQATARALAQYETKCSAGEAALEAVQAAVDSLYATVVVHSASGGSGSPDSTSTTIINSSSPALPAMPSSPLARLGAVEASIEALLRRRREAQQQQKAAAAAAAAAAKKVVMVVPPSPPPPPSSLSPKESLHVHGGGGGGGGGGMLSRMFGRVDDEDGDGGKGKGKGKGTTPATKRGVAFADAAGGGEDGAEQEDGGGGGEEDDGAGGLPVELGMMKLHPFYLHHKPQHARLSPPPATQPQQHVAARRPRPQVQLPLPEEFSDDDEEQEEQELVAAAATAAGGTAAVLGHGRSGGSPGSVPSSSPPSRSTTPPPRPPSPRPVSRAELTQAILTRRRAMLQQQQQEQLSGESSLGLARQRARQAHAKRRMSHFLRSYDD